MENITPSYACSPSVLSGAFSGAHSAAAAGTRTAFGLGLGHTGVILAPVPATTRGTGLSIAAMRDKTAAAQARTTALLPISDVVVFDGLAGIRSWSPPV